MNKKEELIKLIEKIENHKTICFMLGIAKGVVELQNTTTTDQTKSNKA